MRASICLLVCLASLLGFGCGPGIIRAPEGVRGASAPRAEGPARVHVRRLLVSHVEVEGSHATRTKEEALDRARMLAGMARDRNQSFRELVAEYGDTPPDRDDRNTVRVLERGDSGLSEAHERAVFRLDVGQVSHPLDTEHGYAIFLREPDPDATAAGGPAEIGARHILISHVDADAHGADVTRSREEASALAARVAEAARAEGADWTALHAEYSDEPGSPTDGDLGVFGRGQMVPAFERAAFALDVDAISAPVESQYGFHIIQRTQ